MTGPYKTEQTFTYSETVYFDANGTEVHRDRNFDDSLHDESGPMPVTDEEAEDYYGGES